MFMDLLKCLCIFYLRFTCGYINNKTEKNLYPIMKEFSSYTTIKPEIYQEERIISSSLDIKDSLHNPFLTLNLHLNGQRMNIELKRNDGLVLTNHSLQLQNINTTMGYIINNLTSTKVKFCHYQGSIRGKPKSSVVLSTCTGAIDAIIFDGIETYFIYPGDAQNLQDKHLLFRQTDLVYNSDTSKNGMKLNNKPLRSKREVNSNIEPLIAPYNANKYSSYIEFLIVIDNALFNSFGRNVEKIHQHCKDLTNIINVIYAQLNIFVVLVNVIIWNKHDEIRITTNARETLENFLIYRKTKLLPKYPHDHAQLLILEKFEKGIVGKAYLDTICSTQSSGAVCVDDSSVIGLVASTMAHEMGHNFGLPHDTENCACNAETCVMSATSSSLVAMQWSNCSLDYMSDALTRKMNYCMQNKPNRSFNAPNCGNGFVDSGEQCDCGLPEYCLNTCCDPHTCLLRSNATCAAGECCDLQTCNMKLAGSMCRAAENVCDLPEFCTGDSEFCPLDVFKRDLELCDSLAYCYQGKCQTHSSQCQLLWGITGENLHSVCYERNLDGNRLGNCGYDRFADVFIPCQEGHQLCGMLFCRQLTEKLEIGSPHITQSSTYYVPYNRSALTCKSTLMDFGLDNNDPGLTPNGAKCGENKMCLDQKCVAIEILLAKGMGKLCSNNCSGNGVCNSLGNCHCDIGFGGANCSLPGPGGSVDSGPATNTEIKKLFRRFVLIFFCGVIPCAAVCILFLCSWRHCKYSAVLKKSCLKDQKNLGCSNKADFVCYCDEDCQLNSKH